MKFTFKTLMYLVAVAVSINVGAANITTPLPGKCTAFKPEALYSPILYTDVANKLMSSSSFGQTSINKEKEYWVVYSDRSNNTTYVAPGSTVPFKALEFNEKVKIAQISRGYALVYSDPKEQGNYPNISSMAEWKGWIPMSKLLLWDSCPANRAGIYEKAMPCVNIDEKVSDGSLLKLFFNPSNLKDYRELPVNFNYYFVMKREGKMVLLASQNTMNGNTYKVLFGWVDSNSYVAWNQRSCLEPTWDIEDVEYFAKNGTKVNIYEDRPCSVKASSIIYEKKSADEFDPYMYRMDGNNLRYPILDDSKGLLWNCSTFSTPNNDGIINKSSSSRSGTGNVFQKNLDELSNIKIAIVIDGTKSMEKYFPAVSDAISEFTSFFQKSDKVKVGVMIYRDKMDGEYVTDPFPMTNPENPALRDFLVSGGRYGIKSSPKDKSLEEALYYGIDKALDSFGFKPEESNMMFVIGDCGNSSDYPEITKEYLKAKLVEKNVTLMGFQVRNDSSVPAFTIFNNNIATLIKESLQAKFDALYSTPDAHVVVKAQMKGNEYEFVNDAASLENSLYIGSHKYVQSGVMNPSELTEQLKNSVVTVKNVIEREKELVVDLNNGIASFSVSPDINGNKLDMEWLRRRIGDDKVFYGLVSSHKAVSFKGYTAKKDKSSGREFYKSVIFITQEELSNLMLKLKDLNEVAKSKGDDRLPYANAMKALVLSMLPGISDSEINTMGVDEIMSLVSGLNVHTRTTKGHTIPEIMSRQAVNAAEYQTIVKGFSRQYKKLQTIQKNPYPFVKEFNGAKYYWIPTEDMP